MLKLIHSDSLSIVVLPTSSDQFPPPIKGNTQALGHMLLHVTMKLIFAHTGPFSSVKRSKIFDATQMSPSFRPAFPKTAVKEDLSKDCASHINYDKIRE